MPTAAVSFHSSAAKTAFLNQSLCTPSAVIDESRSCLVLDAERASLDLELASSSPHVYQVRHTTTGDQ